MKILKINGLNICMLDCLSVVALGAVSAYWTSRPNWAAALSSVSIMPKRLGHRTTKWPHYDHWPESTDSLH